MTKAEIINQQYFGLGSGGQLLRQLFDWILSLEGHFDQRPSWRLQIIDKTEQL